MCVILAAIGLREAPPAVDGEKNARPATAGDGKHRVRIAAMAKRIRHRGPDWSTIEVRDATQRNALRAPNAAERRRAASRAESAEASGGKEAEVSAVVDSDGPPGAAPTPPPPRHAPPSRAKKRGRRV